MPKGAFRAESDRDGGNLEWVERVDQSLTWVRPTHPYSVPAGLSWWPGLEQERELIDFHARYERACIED